MAISIKCPECGRKLNAPDSAAGRRARCPHCKAIVTLPAAGTVDDVLEAEPVTGGLPPGPEDDIGIAPPPMPAGGGGGGGGRRPPPMPVQDAFDDEIPLAPPAMPAAAPAADTSQPRRPCPMCGEM